MINPTFSMLDQTELCQLAHNASSANDPASAIAYLKEAVSRSDATAIAHYMLGAEYAQIGMYKRAIDEMENTVALDPALATARLQLGLLWLGANSPERALTVLSPLAELTSDSPLRHFGAGLCCLIAEKMDEAVARLEEGITLNVSNPPLSADMRKIVEEIKRLGAIVSVGSVSSTESPASLADESKHVLLSAYTSKSSH